jgi:selenium metabolism protein YedF
MRIVDTKGKLCPEPLIATKRALNETASGESFVLLTDNLTSFNNVCRFLRDNKTSFKFTETAGIWSLTITKESGDIISTRAEEYCAPEVAHFERGDFVIAFSSDKMGDGDESLGLLLIVNFIKALKDLDKLPSKMVFYNKGVKLVTKTSPVFDHLKDLEKMGVELFCCATCINHYKIEPVVGVGTLSNMYEIADVMTKAGSVIKP